MMFVLSTLALLQANSTSPTAEVLANGRWKTMSTKQLAAQMLPPELARTVVGHKANPPIDEDGPPIAITFFGKPRASLDGFCERARFYVSVSSGSPMATSTDVRMGACPSSASALFAHVNPGATVAESKAAVRWLTNAVTAARGSQMLPFEVVCTAEVEPNLCAEGARAALAKLPTENAFIVDGAFNCRSGQTEFAIRHDPANSNAVWDVRLVRADGQRPRLQLTWMVPPPF